ncbi:MAG: DUF4296 domain-containing protein [Bacteroidales bacterium]|nr:DUF4296 domain-containing protein [Paludibacteraceae bacterium]MBP5758190.1 DUF4296 domain-containing protein [Bacteroidales bacterium]
MKQKVLLCLLVLPLLVVGCRPRNVLSVHQMKEVLYDLHRVEGLLSVYGYEWQLDSTMVKYYGAVLDKHGITQAQFDSSLVWYTDHPQMFDKIYPHIIQRLEAEQKELSEQLTSGVRDLRRLPQRQVPSFDLDKTLDRSLHGLQPIMFRQKEEN